MNVRVSAQSQTENNQACIAPPLSDEFYAESYQLRKAASTMTASTIKWFQQHIGVLLEKSHVATGENQTEKKTFSVLSIGSGEGDIDCEIIDSLITHLKPTSKQLTYVALEPNATHRERFQQRVDQAAFDENVIVQLRDDYFDLKFDDDQSYDLVLLTHVLYYFDEPYHAIQHALAHTHKHGQLVIVHQTETGIPQIQQEHMLEVKGDQQGMLSAEAIKTLLDQQLHVYQSYTVDAYLEATECLQASALGMNIMSFCLECDLRQLPEATFTKIVQAFRQQAEIQATGQALIYEPLGVFVVPATPDVTNLGRSKKDNDPVDDYWQLAQRFDWASTLLSQYQRRQAPSFKLLDIACGTGRWLRVFNHYIELDKAIEYMRYDCLDPCGSSIAQIQPVIMPPFESGEQYTSTLQAAELDEHSYDLLWSMHGFYNIPYEDLAAALKKCANLLTETGLGFIALATRKSFYVDFYEQYLQIFKAGKGVCFTAAEDVIEVLSALNIPHHVHTIAYEEAIKADDTVGLEHYIKNEATVNCFNKDKEIEPLSDSKTITLDNLYSHPQMKEYLNGLMRNGAYYFPQEVFLISLINNSTTFQV